MKGFYSDTFILPLPERHRFPMVKYSMLRERVARDGIRGPGELRTPRAVSDEEILCATTRWHRRYRVPANARRRPGGGARRRGCRSRHLYLAGADPFQGDRLGRLCVTKSGLAEREQIVLETCSERGIPVTVMMATTPVE